MNTGVAVFVNENVVKAEHRQPSKPFSAGLAKQTIVVLTRQDSKKLFKTNERPLKNNIFIWKYIQKYTVHLFTFLVYFWLI